MTDTLKIKETDTIFITEPAYPGIEKRSALIMDEIAMLGANAVSLSSKKHLLASRITGRLDDDD